MASPTVTVTVKYAKPGTQPPVYLAGSFSDPTWQPHEMEYTTNADGEYEYHKDVQVEEGKEYQYKFRLGSGDWWTLNEDAPTVTDDIGNRNNLLAIPAHKGNNSKIENLPDTPPPQEESLSKSDMENQGTHKIERASGSADKEHSTKPLENPQTITPDMGVEYSAAEERSQTNEGFKKEEAADIPNPQLLAPQAKRPNHVVSSERARTPELADTAAEVADTAAKLDHEEPTPPVSDDEAGRIGYRRMSNTPIPQVAKVAAEVADVAASLDQESLEQVDTAPAGSFDEEDDGFDSGAETPPEERVPLFPHECPGPNDLVVQSRRESIILPPSPSRPAEDKEIDLNDPTLTPFPTSREGIYAEIRSMEGRLPMDEVRLDGSPSLSAPTNGRNPERIDLLMPSPRMLTEQSPSLGSIDEGQEVEENPLELPKAFAQKSEEQNPENLGEENGIAERGPTPVSGIENQKADVKKTEQVPITVARMLNPDIQLGSSTEELLTTKSPSAEDPKLQTTPIVSKQGDAPPASNKISDSNLDNAAEDSGVDMEDDPKPERKSVSKDNHTVPSPITPFIVGNRQLGHDDEPVRKISSGDQGPSITIQSATPRSSMKAGESDTAESSGIASGESPSTRSRKQQVVSPSSDRPRTPASIRSNNQHIKDKNFLKAIWRVVFVEWIGGFMKKLCGGRRKT